MKLVSVIDNRGNVAVYGSRIRRQCVVSNITVQQATALFERAVLANTDDEACDLMARGVSVAIQELRLARRLRRARR